MKDFDLEEAKTSNLAKKVERLGLVGKKLLLVDSLVPNNLLLAAKNLPKVKVLPVVGLNVLDITKNDKVIITLSGLEKLTERLEK
jgi:large subunit ribosomal protein L4